MAMANGIRGANAVYFGADNSKMYHSRAQGMRLHTESTKESGILKIWSLLHAGEVEIVQRRSAGGSLLQNVVILCIFASGADLGELAVLGLGVGPFDEEASPLAPSEEGGPAGEGLDSCCNDRFHPVQQLYYEWDGSNLGSGSVFFCQENHFDILIARHVLHCLQVADLHGCLAAEDVGSLPHQFGGLNFGGGVEDLGLRESLLLGHCCQDVLQFLVEHDVLDEDVGDFDTPLMYLPGHEFPQFQGDLIPLLEQFLQDVVAADRPQSGEGEFLDALVDVGHAVEGPSGDLDVVVDCCVDVHFDVVAGEGLLARQIDDIGLHVHDVDAVRERVEVLQP